MVLSHFHGIGIPEFETKKIERKIHVECGSVYKCTPRHDNIHITIIHTHYFAHIGIGKILTVSAVTAAAAFLFHSVLHLE